jgi:polyisoprenoid-binding protein YceI
MNMQKKDQIGADAVGTVKRSDYKADKYVPMVQDEVTVTIAIEARAP